MFLSALNAEKKRGSVLPKMAFCGLIAVVLITQHNQLVRSAKTNFILLKLFEGIERHSQEIEPAITQVIHADALVAQNPRVAWAGGLYLFEQGASYAEVKRFWSFAPEYTAKAGRYILWRVKDNKQKIALAQIIVEISPLSLDAHRALAEALMANEEWEMAARELDNLLKALPDDGDLNAVRGLVEYRRGGSAEASKRFLFHALDIEPLNRIALYNLVGLADYYFYNSGPTDQFVSFLLEALARYPENPGYDYDFYLNGWLVEAYFRRGELQKIPPYLEAALDIHPESSWMNRRAGDYDFAYGKFDEAIRRYRK